MPDTLRDYVAEFVGKPPGSIGIVMIHLRRAREREPVIAAMQCAMRTPFEILDAAEGAALIAAGHPTACGIDPGVVRTAGEVGCMVSHVEAARAALAGGLSHLVVFEDDCFPGVGDTLALVRGYLAAVKEFSAKFQLAGTDEFLLLSTCGCYMWKPISRGLKVTNHFNGSHAYIMGRGMMQKMVDMYEDLLSRGLTAPVDGILPILLQRDGRFAVCPENDGALFYQDRDLPTYVASDDGSLRRD